MIYKNILCLSVHNLNIIFFSVKFLKKTENSTIFNFLNLEKIEFNFITSHNKKWEAEVVTVTDIDTVMVISTAIMANHRHRRRHFHYQVHAILSQDVVGFSKKI